ncbi:GNAT family N-acetyltransferase [Haloactinospora alba]|uniref:GNAT family N-acetyltransferase n=1 Tax=Haloactinospora alba TaxID=405555 RepID=UPI001B85D0DA|nr:GNAT family N-acetyltransferase [Haloactinospora alba]
MRDPYPLRPLEPGEFDAWARMTCDTYGSEWREGALRNAASTIELDRTTAAFDGGEVVGGGAILTRTMTVPGAVLPVAGVTLVAVTPTYQRRGIMTAMMRGQLTALHESGGEPVAALNAAEAMIYGRYGYGTASHVARIEGQRREMRLRSGTDLGDGTVRLFDRDSARPLLEEVYERARGGAVGWLARPARFWDARLYDEEHVRDGASSLRFAVHQCPDGEATGYVFYRVQSAPVPVERCGSSSWRR